MKSDRAAPGEEALAHGHRASDAEAEAGDRDDRFSGGLQRFFTRAKGAGGALRRTRSRGGMDAAISADAWPQPPLSGGESSDGGGGSLSEAGGYSDAGSSAGGSRDFDRGGGFASKGGSRGGGALLPSTRPSRMHKGSKSTGGSALPSDVLGFSCSFKLPSNSQLCRLFAAMTAFLLLLNTASCGFFYCYGSAFPYHVSRGRANAAHSDLYQLYERSQLALTQANMANRRGFGDELYGQAQTGAAASADDPLAGTTKDGDPAPLMIPRIIHQTYKSNAVPDRVRSLMASWTRLNPGWEVRFYDDQMCREFVRTEFPEYYQAYLALPKDVERSDFFRYLIVLHVGGVYADIDCECRAPLDRFLRSADTLVVGWEGEFATDEMAYSRHFVRRRQVLNWVFAGAPGHPALREICDHIARSVHKVFTNNTNRDTLERTGPGAFTDVVLRQFWKHSRARGARGEGGESLVPRTGSAGALVEDELAATTDARGVRRPDNDAWNVRVMPKVSFGTHPSGEDGISQDDPAVLVAHHFLGSWKSREGWSGARRGVFGALRTFWHSIRRDLPEYRAKMSKTDKWYAMPRVNQRAGYPTSANWEPPFDVLTHVVGSDASVASTEAAGAALTARGRWQAGRAEPRTPTAAEALVGSLAAHRRSAALLDVGAGLGYYSLAAAARGHRVIAYEAEAAASGLFDASVAHNGFGPRVDLRRVRLGGKGEAFCRALVASETDGETRDAATEAALRETTARLDALDAERAAAAAADGGSGGAEARVGGGADEDEDPGSAGAGDRSAGDFVRLAGRRGGPRRARVEPRGRSSGRSSSSGDDPKAAKAGAAYPSPPPPLLSSFECPLATALGIRRLDDVISAEDDVAAMRVASDGWEQHVLEGARDMFATRPPPIVLLELTPRRLRVSPAAPDALGNARAALERLYSLGYTDVAHSGAACDERWTNITRYVNSRGGLGMDLTEAMRQPTWCHSAPANFPTLAERADADWPESVLLHHVAENANRLERERADRLAALTDAAGAAGGGAGDAGEAATGETADAGLEASGAIEGGTAADPTATER